MPYREQQFANGEMYHLIIKGIDGNLLFKDIDDYYRGIFSIYEFNNSNPVSIYRRRKEIAVFKKSLKNKKVQGRALSQSFKVKDDRGLIVEILSFCFMPNHIHLLVKQIKEGGITKFMSKLGTGYASYFNKRYERKGYVFQNRFASIHIRTDEQLKTIFVYIHANPISLVEPKWKEAGIKNPDKAIKFLENKYRWSSYFDYIGKQNFSSVTERNFMLKVMGGIFGCKKSVNDWARYKGEMRDLEL